MSSSSLLRNVQNDQRGQVTCAEVHSELAACSCLETSTQSPVQLLGGPRAGCVCSRAWSPPPPQMLAWAAAGAREGRCPAWVLRAECRPAAGPCCSGRGLTRDSKGPPSDTVLRDQGWSLTCHGHPRGKTPWPVNRTPCHPGVTRSTPRRAAVPTALPFSCAASVLLGLALRR